MPIVEKLKSFFCLRIALLRKFRTFLLSVIWEHSFKFQEKYISRRKSKSMVAISQHIHFIFCSCAPVIFMKIDCMILSHNGYISIPQLMDWVIVDVSHKMFDTGASIKSECTLIVNLDISDRFQLI